MDWYDMCFKNLISNFVLFIHWFFLLRQIEISMSFEGFGARHKHFKLFVLAYDLLNYYYSLKLYEDVKCGMPFQDFHLLQSEVCL